MSAYTVYAPGAWIDDAQSAMESWAYDLYESPHAERNRADAPGMIDVLAQYEDGSRMKRHGKGYRWRFDLSIEGVKALRGEALYRYEFHGGNGNPYGCEDPEPVKREAARVLMERCEAILAGG